MSALQIDKLPVSCQVNPTFLVGKYIACVCGYVLCDPWGWRTICSQASLGLARARFITQVELEGTREAQSSVSPKWTLLLLLVFSSTNNTIKFKCYHYNLLELFAFKKYVHMWVCMTLFWVSSIHKFLCSVSKTGFSLPKLQAAYQWLNSDQTVI